MYFLLWCLAEAVPALKKAELTGRVCWCASESTTLLTGRCYRTVYRPKRSRERSFKYTWATKQSLCLLLSCKSEWMNLKHSTTVYLIMNHPAGSSAVYHLKESKWKCHWHISTNRTKPRSQNAFFLCKFGLLKHICVHICILTQTRAPLHNITWQTHAAARCLITGKNRLSERLERL